MPDIDPDVQRIIDEIDSTLQDGEDAFSVAMVGLHDQAHADLEEGEAALHSVIDYLAGTAGNQLDDGFDGLHKSINHLSKTASETLGDGEGMLRDQGWRYPYDPGHISEILDMGAANVLPHMVPEIAALKPALPQPGPGDIINTAGCQPGCVEELGQYAISGYTADGQPIYQPVCDDATTNPEQCGQGTPTPTPTPTPDGCVSCMDYPISGSVPTALAGMFPPEGPTQAQIDAAIASNSANIQYVNAAGHQCVYNLNTGLATCFPNPGECDVPNPLCPFYADPDRLIPPPYCEDGATPGYIVPGQVPPMFVVSTRCPPTVPTPTPLPLPLPLPTPVPLPTPLPLPIPDGKCCPPQPAPIVNVYVPPSVCPTPTPTTPPTVPKPPPTVPPPPRPPAPEIASPQLSEWQFNWTDRAACQRVDAWVDQQRPSEFYFDVTTDTGDVVSETAAGWLTAQLGGDWVNQVGEFIVEAVSPVIATGVSTLIAFGGKILTGIFNKLYVGGSTKTSALIKLATEVSLAATAERLTGAPIRYFNQDSIYAMQYLSPAYLPEQGDVDELYRRREIDRDTFICLTRARGNIPTWREQVVRMQQGRASVADLNQLLTRGLINPGEYYGFMVAHGYTSDRQQAMVYQASQQVMDLRTALEANFRGLIDGEQTQTYARAAGWRDPEVVRIISDTMQFIPPYTDIIRMMVHDVEDASVVSDYLLDTNFTDKYTGQLRAWGEQQRIPQEAARYMWRSHWSYPSPTEVYQFIRRLRPDRPERVQWEANNKPNPGESELEYRNRGPIAFTIQDARRLLSINDKAPRFIDPEIAVSYNPITRTDAIRAYELGALDDDGLKWNFIQNGYVDADAELLVAFEHESKARRIANATGVLTIRKIVKYYKGGAMNRERAEVLLRPLMVNPKDRQNILDRADEEMSAETRTARLAATQRRFRYGEWAPAELPGVLMEIGVDKYAANEIADQWIFRRRVQQREPTANMLCKWRDRGFITDADYFARLQRIGYSYEDASRIMAVCVSDFLKKQREAAEKAKLASQKELEKSLKNQYELTHATEKQLASWKKKLATQLDAVDREMEGRPQVPGEGITQPN